MSINKYKNHISITTANDVGMICMPLFDNTPVCYFRYSRIYKNKTCFTLVSDPYWQEFCLKNKPVENIVVDSHTPGYYRIKDIKNIDLVSEYLASTQQPLDVTSGLSILKNFADYSENLSFGLRTNEQNEEFCLNNKEGLERYFLYFKEQAADLIKTADKPWNRLSIKKNIEYQSNTTTLIDKLPIKIFFCGIKGRLSQRETECLIYLFRGRTARETAEQLGISAKSVDTNISRAKIKLDCDSKADLFDKAIAYGFINLVKYNTKER